MNFRLPQSEGAILASLESGSIVQDKRFDGNLAFLRAKGPLHCSTVAGSSGTVRDKKLGELEQAA
jgi:hypothetical protein